MLEFAAVYCARASCQPRLPPVFIVGGGRLVYYGFAVSARAAFSRMFVCTICQCYSRRTLAGVLRHIREVHPHFEGVVKCGLEGCPSTAGTYESLRQHIYKKHKHILKQGMGINSAPQLAQTTENELDSDHQSHDNEDDSDIEIGEGHVAIDSHTDIVRREAAKFILKTRDGRQITQTALNGIIADTNILIENLMGVLEHDVMQKLDEEIPSLCTEGKQRNQRGVQHKFNSR